MGVCTSKKRTAGTDLTESQVREMPAKPPLKALKAELVKNLQLDDSHHFTVFARYHFWNSYRRSLQLCQKNFEHQEGVEEAKMATDSRVGIDDQLVPRKKG